MPMSPRHCAEVVCTDTFVSGQTEDTVTRLGSKTVAAGALALLVLVGCGGDSDEGADPTIVLSGDDDTTNDGGGEGDGSGGGDGSDDGGDGNEGSDGGSDDGSAGDAGSGDFMTVFGLPPGQSVETDWAPYERREDEFGLYEAVVFEVTGASVDEIIGHYEATLPSMGYEVGPRLELGDSIAINITDPDNAATTAVIQAGETDDVVTVNQNITVPAPPPDATTTEPAEAVSSDAESG